MKRICFVFFVFISLFVSSCSNEETNVQSNEDVTYNSSNPMYVAAKNEIKDVLGSVSERAFDGESIDVEEFEKIISEKTGLTKEQIIKIEDEGFTRSTEDNLKKISINQEEVINKLATFFSEKESITDDDLIYVNSLCSKLSDNERQEIVLGVLIAKMSIDAASELEINNLTRAGWTQTIICGLACEGCAGIWGYMAKGVLVAAGIGTGGGAAVAGWVVSAVGGIVLSKIAC